MAHRWRNHCALAGWDRDAAQNTFAEMIAAYAEPHRRYHTATHLTALFQDLNLVERHMDEPLRAAMAVWFHDIVYDPRRTDNEARSADIAELHLERLGLNAGLITDVTHLIRATANHAGGGRDLTDALVLDADLAILGDTPDNYQRYVSQIRAEFAHITDEAWALGRGAFLEKHLRRPQIFHTAHFQDRYGEKARINMQHEHDGLRRPPDRGA